jgi:hypothetical protein
MTLQGLIDGQPSQDSHREWVRHIAFDASGGVAQRQCTGSQAVIVNNPLGFGHHIGVGGAADLVGAGAAFQTIVQACDA